MADIIETVPDVEKLRTEIGIDPLVSIDELFITGTGKSKRSNRPDSFVVIAKGSYDAELVLAELEVSSQEAEAKTTCLSRTALFGDLLITALTKRTIALGTPDLVEQTCELARKNGTSIAKSPGFEDFRLHFGEVVVFRFVKSGDSPDFDTLPGPFSDFGWGEKIETADGSISVAEHLQLHIDVVMTDEQSASRVKREIVELVNTIKRNPISLMFGLDRYLEKVSTKSNGRDVSLNIFLDSTDIEALRKLTDRLKQIRDMLASQEEQNQVVMDPPLLKHRLNGSNGEK